MPPSGGCRKSKLRPEQLGSLPHQPFIDALDLSSMAIVLLDATMATLEFMTIKVLFYGYLRDIYGTHVLVIEVGKSCTLNELFSKFLQGPIEDFSKISCVVNWESRRRSAPLRAGDEVALLPFV